MPEDYRRFSSPYPITGEPICFAGIDAYETTLRAHADFTTDAFLRKKEVPMSLTLSVEEIVGSISKLNKPLAPYPRDARITKAASADRKMPGVPQALPLEKVRERRLR